MTTSVTSRPTCSSRTSNATCRAGRCSMSRIAAVDIEHWYLTAPRTAERRSEVVATPGAGEVLVRVAWTAISPGSNVHVWRTGSYASADGGTLEELLYMGSGVVSDVGAGVTSVAPGDRVVLSTGHQS